MAVIVPIWALTLAHYISVAAAVFVLMQLGAHYINREEE